MKTKHFFRIFLLVVGGCSLFSTRASATTPEEIQALKTQLSALEHRITQLKANYTACQVDFHQAEAAVFRFTQEQVQLRQELDQLKQEIARLTHRNEALSADNQARNAWFFPMTEEFAPKYFLPLKNRTIYASANQSTCAFLVEELRVFGVYAECDGVLYLDAYQQFWIPVDQAGEFQAIDFPTPEYASLLSRGNALTTLPLGEFFFQKEQEERQVLHALSVQAGIQERLFQESVSFYAQEWQKIEAEREAVAQRRREISERKQFLLQEFARFEEENARLQDERTRASSGYSAMIGRNATAQKSLAQEKEELTRLLFQKRTPLKKN